AHSQCCAAILTGQHPIPETQMHDITPPVATATASTETPRKVALITGAARGIGAATVEALTQQGFACVIAVRNPEAAQDVRDRVLELGMPCLVQKCDITDYDAVTNCVHAALQAFGRLD